MDNQQRARLSTLLQRQQRKLRTPSVLDAWRKRGIAVSAVNDERCEQVVGWLRTNWTQPTTPSDDLQNELETLARDANALLVVDFWQWDEAVAVLVPAGGLLRTASELRQIYPDGFMVADQGLSAALLVDFDDVDGSQVATIRPHAAA
jgi:hypothetical protein